MSVETWRRRLYPDDRHVSPVDLFFEHVEHVASPSMEVLEVGSGAGEINQHMIRGRVGHLIGIDLSERVLTNPLVDEGVVGDITHAPFESGSFDLAFAVYVLEHVMDPDRFCSEIRRLLRPGGRFLALTPNRYHYVALVSQLTPHQFHEWFNRTSTRGHDEADTFPTYYRMNSRSSIYDHLSRAGFTDIKLQMVEVQPNYLMWSTAAFLLGAAYERLVNRVSALADLRVNIIVSAQVG